MNLFDTRDPRPLHFMGIAGAGMRALALVARSRGVPVTGCDQKMDVAPDLVAAGIRVAAGHDGAHVEGARALVVTSAVPSDHPEIERARDRGVPVLKRAEALAAIVRGRTVMAVAGTHGKTTTTVMATEALAAAGRDPTGIAGGLVSSWRGNARIGGDTVVVVEADEYDRSFLTLEPTVAIVTNVEPDHLECYGGSAEALESAFAEFAGRAEQCVTCVDDEGAERLARRLEGDVWRVTLDPHRAAEVRVREMVPAKQGTEVVLDVAGTEIGFRLGVPGRHNVVNASCALAGVSALGGDVERAAAGVAAFTGVGRRFERLGVHGGVDLVDDYAHHPTELRATLEAARQVFGDRRLLVIFQPHLFSRTQQLHQEMGQALSGADSVFVAAIYPAREASLPGVTGALVADAARAAGVDARYVEDRERLFEAVLDGAHPGDVVMTVGAGDVTEWVRVLGARLAERADLCG